MNKKELIEEGFICIEDNKVYVRIISFIMFEFAEKDVKKVIDLSDYTNEQIKKFIGEEKSIRKLFQIYLEETNFVIAGIIFQQESGLYKNNDRI